MRGAFILWARLEPADSIGGDTFDYSLARYSLHLSVADAMGHGVGSALTATLGVGSRRNTRRMGCTLLEQAAAANLALLEHGPERATEAFATALPRRLDLRIGTLALVNAGHVPPYLYRAGTVTPLELPANLPLGLCVDTVYEGTYLVLRRGDRMVLVMPMSGRCCAADVAIAVPLMRLAGVHGEGAARPGSKIPPTTFSPSTRSPGPEQDPSVSAAKCAWV